MTSLEVARQLRHAGLAWDSEPGDAFALPDRGMDDRVFVVSGMSVEMHESPSGPVIGFNGAVEWALDSIDQAEALWLPREDQLRELLADRFDALEREADGFRVTYRAEDGAPATARAPVAADAYAMAVLDLLLSGIEVGRSHQA